MRDIHSIVDEHTIHLLQLAYFYTKSHHVAEDLVQDVFIKFCDSDYEERGQLGAYLRRLTVNRCKDYLKSWSYRKIQLQNTFISPMIRKRDFIVEQEERSRIGEVVLSLPVHYREIIILYYFEEMTTVQIAELIKEPESTVRTRLRRAREKLKPLLQEEWEVLMHE